MLKNSENTETEGIGLVTPTPGLQLVISLMPWSAWWKYVSSMQNLDIYIHIHNQIYASIYPYLYRYTYAKTLSISQSMSYLYLFLKFI